MRLFSKQKQWSLPESQPAERTLWQQTAECGHGDRSYLPHGAAGVGSDVFIRQKKKTPGLDLFNNIATSSSLAGLLELRQGSSAAVGEIQRSTQDVQITRQRLPLQSSRKEGNASRVSS
ncbi:uncharacterized protein ACIQIH_006986 isoform 2-T2 [Cyanocitta cristata]